MEIRGRRATVEEAAQINQPRPGNQIGRSEEIDWSPVGDGDWWLVYSGGSADAAEFRRAFERIKRGSIRWAKRHGYERNLRRVIAERKVWVRFTKETK